MSPSGGTRALGSSVIDASCLVLKPDWPKGRWWADSFTGLRARGKALAAALFVRRSTLKMSRNAASMVYEGLRHRALRNSRPPIGPREVNFFPYLSIQLLAFGDYSGVGITRFRLARKAWALTPLSPWGGLCARRFQQDVSARSDRQGGVSLWRDSSSL